MASGKAPVEFAMRSRVGRTSSDGEREQSPSYRDVVLVEKKLKAGDTLNKIAIQYAVNVADIKRVNNLVNDQDFGALTIVKIPVTRMRKELGIGIHSESDDEHVINVDPRTRLLSDSDHSRDTSVEDIFHKADNTIAQAREALPENGVPGSFHFVDAKPPDSGYSVWVLLGGVVFIFMIVPLFLTFLEEKENAEHMASSAAHGR